MALTVVDGGMLSATNAQYTMFKNKLINGNFSIWQRGTSFTSSSVNEYSADRWRTEGNNLSTVISRQTFTAGQTDVPNFPTYYCRVQTNATVASGQYWAFQQRVESPQNLSGYETVVLSFWVKAASGTLPAGTFLYSVNAINWSTSPAITTTWQKLTYTVTLNTGSGGGGYVSVYPIYLPAGTVASTIDIANVQVEIGPTATVFDARPYGTELSLCQRYYWRKTGGASVSTYEPIGSGLVYNTTTNARFFVTYPMPMRAIPTFSTGGTLYVAVGAGSLTPSTITSYAGLNSGLIDVTVTAGTVGNGAVYFTGNTTSDFFQASAEL